jgi:hypothetical protein
MSLISKIANIHGDIQLLVDESKLPTLNDLLDKQTDLLFERISELEKENALLKQVEEIFNASPDLTFDCCKRLFEQEFEAHNLEQRAKGVYDVRATTGFWNLSTCALRKHLREYETILINQAKALKE